MRVFKLLQQKSRQENRCGFEKSKNTLFSTCYALKNLFAVYAVGLEFKKMNCVMVHVFYMADRSVNFNLLDT